MIQRRTCRAGAYPLLTAIAGYMVACESSDSLTQMIVVVDAQEEVSEKLTGVAVEIYDPESRSSDGTPELIDRRPFVLHADRDAIGSVNFPFSVGVLKRNANRFLLVVRGVDGEETVVDQKALVNFVNGQTHRVELYLDAACLGVTCGKDSTPAWFERTCTAQSGGKCVPVPAPDTDPVKPGNELDSGTSLADAAVDETSDEDEPTDDAPERGRPCNGPTSDREVCDVSSPRTVLRCEANTWKEVRTCPTDEHCESSVEATCACDDGLARANDNVCRLSTDDCVNNECLNGSLCVDGESTYTCDCGVTAYTGDRCQTALVSCAGSPCLHETQCSEGVASFSCDCAGSGYDGPRCGNDINECDATNVCGSSLYPCAQTQAPGYTCRGQLADWHMPDASPGAKYVPDYDLGTPDIVRDRVTGLIWERAEAVGTFTQASAAQYCANLSIIAGATWRLPTKIELESIVSFTTYNPAIDAVVFPGTGPSHAFWTSSTSVTTPGSAWTIPNFNGSSIEEPVSNADYHVRCVTGPDAIPSGIPTNRYAADNTLGTIADVRTNLVWQRSESANSFSAEGAQAYCAGLAGTWRVPTVKELLTIVDPLRSNPAVVPAFGGALSEPLWTSTPYVGSAGASWVVFFDRGGSSATLNAGPARVRCVR